MLNVEINPKLSVKKIPKVGKTPKLSYSKIPKDEDGWVDASKYLPKNYDLCLLKTKEKGIVSGWQNVNSWDGLRMNYNDEVMFWKRKKVDLDEDFKDG